VGIKINNMKQRILFVVFFLFSGWFCNVSAQEIILSTKTETVDGKTYYLHTVQTGQTVYSISKAYSVTPKDIYDANPALNNSLPAGSVIRIPELKESLPAGLLKHVVTEGETLYKISETYKVDVADILKSNPGLTTVISVGQVIGIPVLTKKETELVTYETHLVQGGETLYSIASRHNTSVKDLMAINSGLTETLTVGQSIKVPVVKQPFGTTTEIIKPTNDTDCEPIEKLKEYHIALMIPFYLESSVSIDTSSTKNASSYKSLSFIQFYEGAQMALDSLRKAGFNAKVYIYDVADDTTKTASILQKPEFENMNLIIGPFFSSNFKIVAKWALQHEVPVVNPFTAKSDLLTGNPFAFKILPSADNEAMQYATFINSNYPKCNVVIACNDKTQVLAEAIYKKLKIIRGDSVGLYRYLYSTEGLAGISKNISADKINVVITLVEGEAFVSSFLRSMNGFTKNNKIILFGTKNWESYSSIDLAYLQNLNTHICANYFVDFSKSEVVKLFSDFREKYRTEPDYYGVEGYDITLYFSHALMKYGKGFYRCLKQDKSDMLFDTFTFESLPDGGFANTSCMIYRFKDYKAINAKENPLVFE
jgi:LysM repeat protein